MTAEVWLTKRPPSEMWIGGEPVHGGADQREVLDPARNRVIVEVPEADDDVVDRAVRGAAEAFSQGPWRRSTPRARGDALLAIAGAIRDNADELTMLDSLNVGKPIAQARGDVEQAADFFDYYGRVVIDLPDEVIQNDDDQLTLVVREPVGVVAAIVPWNFPITVAAASVAPALAAGNTVVLKPSSITPLSALRLGEIAASIVPPGVFNVISGSGGAAGSALVAHPQVDRITFTGSTEVGQEIMSKASVTVKRLGLELGGKSPTVILDDAPLDAAVQSALFRITLNQGENCAAGSRLILPRSLADRFLGALCDAAARLRVGDPQAETTDIGPMVSASHLQRVRGYMDIAEHEARRLFVGPTPTEAPFVSGFYAPVSLWEAGPGTRLWREEVFGPVLAVTTYEDDEQAIALANDTDFGLLAVIWSGDRGRALRVARQVRAGIVRINSAGSPIHGPWGGFKMSGIGRGYGRYAYEESTELKQINLDIS